MTFEKINIQEFPYQGTFQRVQSGRYEDIITVLLECQVDIQLTNAAMGLVAQTADYAIYFKNEGVLIKKEDTFIGERNGETIKGQIKNIEQSQLNRMTAFIKREEFN